MYSIWIRRIVAHDGVGAPSITTDPQSRLLQYTGQADIAVDLRTPCAPHCGKIDWLESAPTRRKQPSGEQFVRLVTPMVALSARRVGDVWGDSSSSTVSEIVQEVFLKLCEDDRRILREFEDRGNDSFLKLLRTDHGLRGNRLFPAHTSRKTRRPRKYRSVADLSTRRRRRRREGRQRGPVADSDRPTGRSATPIPGRSERT